MAYNTGYTNQEIQAQLDVADDIAKINSAGIVKVDGSGNASKAVSGTDYQAPLVAGANITISGNTISATGGADKKVTLSLTSSWTSQTGYSEQTVTITGYTVTNNTKIDIQPDYSVISQMATDGCTALYIQNNNGTLKAIAVGTAPTTSLSVQVTIVETEAL